MSDGPSNKHEIEAYLHCSLCLEEVVAKLAKQESASPRDYAQLEVGWTPRGFQVWCHRHDVNVMHVDFEGHKHKANTTRRRKKEEVN